MYITSEQCSWCDGSGVDSEGVENGSYYGCVDCRGTGFVHYEEGRDKYNEELNRSLDSMLDKLVTDIDEQINTDLSYLKQKRR